jgi:hypothetical protein
MHSFCTLFDSRYLSRGLALYESLQRCGEDFHLYIFPFDKRAEHILRAMNLPRATIVALAEFEDEELLRIKATRLPIEYCWTCTPSIILHVLQRFGADRCTYIDADLWFYSPPGVLLYEMGNNSVLITEHRYTPRYDKSRKSGKYCVQFISFRNDSNGLTVLRWWRDACNEWCYARVEDGKFGDQKYLDDWTTRFKGVHVLQHLGGGVAPWNVQQYSILSSGNGLRGVETVTGREFDLIFYHFHYVRFFGNGLVDLGRRTLSAPVLDIIYKPYLRELERLKKKVQDIDSSFDPHGADEWSVTWKSPLLFLWRTMKGTYNVFSLNEFL